MGHFIYSKGKRLFCLLLAAVMLLPAGCAGKKADAPEKPAGQESPVTPSPGQDEPATPATAYTVGNYDTMVPFDKMPYTRPDMEALEKLFADTTAFAQSAKAQDQKALVDRLELCWDAYNEFCTMDTLAMLRSDLDQSDQYYADEYAFFMESEVLMASWLSQLLVACAASEADVPRHLLAGYDGADREPYSQAVLSLMSREARLKQDYWRAMMLDEIQLDGRLQSYSEYIADPLLSDEAYQTAYMAYLRACNELAAPIFVDLVKVRRALAKELGYDSYEQYQYAAYRRDYTPQQVHAYLDEVAASVAPYSLAFMAGNPSARLSYEPISGTGLILLLGKATAHMGAAVEEAYAFMREYRLCDVTVSTKKATDAYTIYIPSYEAPFCFLDPYGLEDDFLDLAHEFGHFADAYVNGNATSNLDLVETYSQAMANLALMKSREHLSSDSYHNLLLVHFLANLNIFTGQTAFADFESRVYALSDEDLTVENINALAQMCAKRFGAADIVGGDEMAAIYWTQVTHLFESPFYVISYCVSADAAFQIAAQEMARPGSGVDCYAALLDWREDAFLSELERVGLESPFAPGRIAENLALAEQIMESGLADYLHVA